VFDYRDADLKAADRALCDYAVKLTVRPGEANAADLDGLRRCGFRDEQIVVAVQVISYFNYINRVADGLGVDAEEWMDVDEAEWQERKARWR